jgi:hypothetical protein
MTPSGIDPATFRFVVQCLKRCATASPQLLKQNKCTAVQHNYFINKINLFVVNLQVHISAYNVAILVKIYRGYLICNNKQIYCKKINKSLLKIKQSRSSVSALNPVLFA